jgi:hypothetical protein
MMRPKDRTHDTDNAPSFVAQSPQRFIVGAVTDPFTRGHGIIKTQNTFWLGAASTKLARSSRTAYTTSNH